MRTKTVGNIALTDTNYFWRLARMPNYINTADITDAVEIKIDQVTPVAGLAFHPL